MCKQHVIEPTDYEIEYCTFHAAESRDQTIESMRAEIERTTRELFEENEISRLEYDRIIELINRESFMTFIAIEVDQALDHSRDLLTNKPQQFDTVPVLNSQRGMSVNKYFEHVLLWCPSEDRKHGSRLLPDDLTIDTPVGNDCAFLVTQFDNLVSNMGDVPYITTSDTRFAETFDAMAELIYEQCLIYYYG